LAALSFPARSVKAVLSIVTICDTFATECFGSHMMEMERMKKAGKAKRRKNILPREKTAFCFSKPADCGQSRGTRSAAKGVPAVTRPTSSLRHVNRACLSVPAASPGTRGRIAA
jgi:hypothetical protein